MKTVYVPMTADFLHHGHINIIKTAKGLGKVIVGLLSDEAIAAYKGIPLLKFNQRKIIVENIKGVDEIIPQETWDYTPNIRKLKPDYVVHGDDWKTGIQKEMRQRVIESLKGWGGKLVEPEYIKEVSSTKFINRLLDIETQYGVSQTEFIGRGSVYKLKNILRMHKPKNIFLVTGKSSFEKSAAKSVSDDFLEDYNVTHFNDFQTNPQLEEVKKGLEIFKENNCDFVIAIGGGSSIDVAKSINIFSSNPGNPEDYIQNKKEIKNNGKVLVAIPTTAGSGSQATHFAVVYIGKTKYSLVHEEFILPDYAIVESVFTESLPADITAHTGMDALSQAIESYWSVNSTEESKKFSEDAIKLVLNNLQEAVNNPSYKFREGMARAAHLAGKAINISKTTACHAISYPITSYFNVPHGHAVALSLPSMLLYNSKVSEEDVLDKRGTEYVRNTIMELSSIMGEKTPDKAAEKIRKLMKSIHLATMLSEIGIKTKEDREIIIKNGFNLDRVKNNPRLLTESNLRSILSEIA
ncbi:MAG: iron-containing alcohol dehydrogenase [Nanoarchaeota archaeon]|nr:iron-containing alcohol dehydrogenase [Nanoarchaeota archaeon]